MQSLFKKALINTIILDIIQSLEDYLFTICEVIQVNALNSNSEGRLPC